MPEGSPLCSSRNHPGVKAPRPCVLLECKLLQLDKDSFWAHCCTRCGEPFLSPPVPVFLGSGFRSRIGPCKQKSIKTFFMTHHPCVGIYLAEPRGRVRV